jgi:glycosyltransferase involved in cell wall biosynthesis
MTPRVLHVITHLSLGGAEKVALELAGRLSATFTPAVLAVHGVGPDAIGAAMQADLCQRNIPLICGSALPLKRGGGVSAAFAARRAVRVFRPDLIHVHTEIPEMAWALAAGLFQDVRAIPVVRTIHNSEYWHHWRLFGRWTDRTLARAAVTAVSHDAARAFERLRGDSGGRSVAPVVIHNALELPPVVERSRRGDPRHHRLLFAGRLELQKGADLLPAIARAVRLPPETTVELVVHGQGQLQPVLARAAAQPPADWLISLLPPVPDLVRRMGDFDALLLPSRFEGLSLLALEAMHMGLPIVASGAPGLREQLPPEHPWIARVGDADDFARVLSAALADRSALHASGSLARAHACARFRPDTMLESYRRVYATAMEQQGRSASHEPAKT